MIKTIEKADFETVSANRRVLVEFYTDNCAECSAMVPYLEKAQAQCDVPFYRFDCNSNREFVMSLGIMALPTVVVYENGSEIARRAGLMEENEILAML